MTERLAQIRQRCEAATPGPWGYDGQHDEITADSPDAKDYWLIVSQCRTAPNTAPRDGFGHQYSPDFAFIAAAREDVPYLLGEIERLRSENTTLREAAVAHPLPADLVQRLVVAARHVYPLLYELWTRVDDVIAAALDLDKANNEGATQ